MLILFNFFVKLRVILFNFFVKIEYITTELQFEDHKVDVIKYLWVKKKKGRSAS